MLGGAPAGALAPKCWFKAFYIPIFIIMRGYILYLPAEASIVKFSLLNFSSGSKLNAYNCHG